MRLARSPRGTATTSTRTRSSWRSAARTSDPRLFGGFTVDASLSQSATAEAAGTQSQLSSLLTSALVLATAVFLAPLFENLPTAVLAGIVITGVLSLMDVAELRRFYRLRRTDFLIAVTAIVGVITTTVLVGLVIAVLLSLVSLLYRASRPYVAVLAELPGPARHVRRREPPPRCRAASPGC